MHIQFVIFITPLKQNSSESKLMMKTFESIIRPVVGDIIDDPGFDSRFHNGYEVVKVTLNYATDTCIVSLAPLVLELQEISIEEYVQKLEHNGWEIVEKENVKA